MRTLAERLEWCANRPGWSRRRLSGAAGASQSYVGQIIRGEVQEPSPETIQRIAKACGVFPDWLARGAGTAFGTGPDEVVIRSRTSAITILRANGVGATAIAALLDQEHDCTGPRSPRGITTTRPGLV
ncbi:helix-turn-helix transcriptional regulator [Endomicrobium sp. AH-315-J14]|nr:helix-turn-helix transcriptional regulator [Endomicrobium sp. AH-315-J14]